MKNVFAYARVSTVLQSADNQLVTLRQVAKRNGWNIVREYTDVMSGVKGRDKRVQFDEMLKSAMRREVDGILFWSIDRASRSVQHLVEMMNELNSKKIHMYFHQQNIDSTTPSGVAMLQMAGVFSQLEVAMTRERVLMAHEKARAEGKRIGRPTLLNDGMVKSICFMRSKSVGIKKIARELSIGVGTVYKVLDEHFTEYKVNG